MILHIVTIQSIFNTDIFLLGPDYLCSNLLESGCYGEVNTGTWFKETKSNGCSLANHLLILICDVIDGLIFDKYGKITVESVLTCCLLFNRKTRNILLTLWV